jgi:hypothetical protein
MLPISRSGNNPSFAVVRDNLDTTQKNSAVNLNLVNLQTRIEENQLFLDGLKMDSQFQNLLTLMRQVGVTDEMKFNFLTGQASLEDCFAKDTWGKNLLVKTYGGLEFRTARSCNSHFLLKSVADTLYAILKPGYFETTEKFSSKMCSLMRTIEHENRSEILDLSNADLTYVDLSYAKLSGVNLAGADLTKACLTYVDLTGQT